MQTQAQEAAPSSELFDGVLIQQARMGNERAFETNDRSHKEWIVGLLGFGEGWHNNHHAFPRSAFHGLHRWQVDCSGYVIWTLERLHLVHDVYRVSPAVITRCAARKASGVPATSVLLNEEVWIVMETALIHE